MLLEGEGGPGAIPEEVLEVFQAPRHVVVRKGDADGGYGKTTVLPGEHVGVTQPAPPL